MSHRNIPKEVVMGILNSPLQIKEFGDYKVYQSLEPDRKHLIHIFVSTNNFGCYSLPKNQKVL